jgi:DNA-binding response OmpR family regulator
VEVFTSKKQKDSQMPFEISPNYGGSSELSPSVILLVDDDPDVRSLTRTFLEHEGYNVFSSGDAERAARELKAIRSEVPVLLISGGVLEERQEAGLQDAGWSFLAKPFRLPELLATVHRILAPVEARRWREAKQGVGVDGLLARHHE